MADKQEILLLNEFRQWLNDDVTPHVASNYVSYLKKINRDFISGLRTGSNMTPLELLKKFYYSSSKGPNIKFVESLLAAVLSNINKYQSELLSKKSEELKEFRSEKNAFRSYIRFMIELSLARPHRTEALTTTQEAVIKNMNGEEIVLDKDDLIDNFAIRINSQDRNTGDKTFFPIGLIGKILDRGQALKWAKEEAQKVKLHLLSDTIDVAGLSALRIDTKRQEVYVTLDDGSEEKVYNPEIGGKKKPMFISQISDTDLDHEPEIHTILQNLQGSFLGLDMLTECIKRKQEEMGYKTINSKNYDQICNALYADHAFQLKLTDQLKCDILADIEKVSSEHILQLTDANWNRSDKKQAKKIKKIK